MDKIFALEVSGGFSYERYSSVEVVSHDKEKLEIEKKKREDHHKEMVRQHDLYYQFVEQQQKDFPPPELQGNFRLNDYPRWTLSHTITAEMRAERAHIKEEIEQHNALLMKPIQEFNLIQELVRAIFAHIHGISKEAIEYHTDEPIFWEIIELPYIE